MAHTNDEMRNVV